MTSGFSLRKKAVGAYFNDGNIIFSYQVSRERESHPSDRLIDAIKVSRAAFLAIRNTRTPQSLITQLRMALDAIDAESAEYHRDKESA